MQNWLQVAINDISIQEFYQDVPNYNPHYAKGIVYIGDSVGAHFHVPATWFTPSELTTGILTNVSYVISNEFDWPDVGFATGFRNATQMPKLIFDDHVDSLYLRLRERNRCNHRDYQVRERP